MPHRARSRRPPIANIIGLKCRIILHTDPSLIGVEGLVVDETKNTIRIRDSKTGRIKTILKKGSVLLLKLPSGLQIRVDGDQLIGTLPERIKKMLKK